MSNVKCVHWFIDVPSQEETTRTLAVFSSTEFLIKTKNPEVMTHWQLEAHIGKVLDHATATPRREKFGAPTHGLSLFLKAKSASTKNFITESVRFNIVDSKCKDIKKFSSNWNSSWRKIKWGNGEVFGIRPLVSAKAFYSNPERFFADGKLHLMVEVYYSDSQQLSDDVLTISDNEEDIHDNPPAEKKARIIDDLFEAFIVNTPDITLKTSDGFELKANIAKLSECSEVFRKMRNEVELDKSVVVEIPDFNRAVVTEALRFFYCGKIQNLETKNIDMELYNISKKYEIKGLSEICLKMMAQNLNAANVLSIVILSEIQNSEEVFEKCCAIIQQSYKYISNCESWQNLDSSLKFKILDAIAELSWMKNIEYLDTKPQELNNLKFKH